MSELAARVPLYTRLPEIYRIRDAEGVPPGQLRAFLATVEEAFGAVHESIEGLYDDLFIETCDDWVVPYIADLLGTTHLSGDPRTLRADVADTVALRRRKGTRAAIERLAANLTGWPCRCVEMFERLAWAQHLNHQRPDAGGLPPYGGADVTRFTVPRGGTVTLRDPAMLSLLGTPFDPFAVMPDVKHAGPGVLHANLPNLAVFLWRLQEYRLPLAIPLVKGVADLGAPPPGSGAARHALRFDLDPLDRPVRLFNTWRHADAVGTIVAMPDAVPGPIPAARLTSGSEAGNPAAYISLDRYDALAGVPEGLDTGDAGLQLFIPQSAVLDGIAWHFRGDNLCAWESGLRRPLEAHEIVVDPVIGRILLGVAAETERDALVEAGVTTKLLAGYTYGAVGPVGAHPISRAASPQGVELRKVRALGGTSLQDALAGLHSATGPVVVEIGDSLLHPLDPTTIPGSITEGGEVTLRLAAPLTIRAASGQRPVIRLTAPLRFRPVDPGALGVENLVMRLEGLFLTREAALPATTPLIARAAVARLEIEGCTLDPGGHRLRDGSRAPLSPALDLRDGYGFDDPADLDAFQPTPDVVLLRSTAGALLVDGRYALTLADSIVDAGAGPAEPADARFAIASASDPANGWSAPLDLRGAHLMGRVRVAGLNGGGGLFLQRLEVQDNQHGCLKFSWLSGDADRLPHHHACLTA
ncbi:MAG TPA: phage tail protein, partial [Roseomonas sp.]